MQEKAENPEKASILKYEPAFEFDDYDRQIMKELDQNARRSLAELSKKVRLSRDAIRNRIQKLIDNNVIISIKPTYNPPRMGYPTINYVFISLYNSKIELEEQFLKFLKNNKHVTYIASLIGKWDYILDIMAESPGHFDTILKEIRRKFPELVRNYEVIGVLQEYKYEEVGRLAYE